MWQIIGKMWFTGQRPGFTPKENWLKIIYCIQWKLPHFINTIMLLPSLRISLGMKMASYCNFTITQRDNLLDTVYCTVSYKIYLLSWLTNLLVSLHIRQPNRRPLGYFLHCIMIIFLCPQIYLCISEFIIERFLSWTDCELFIKFRFL